MTLRVVRLGAPRVPDEGLRLGTVRRPPRGIAKADLSRRDYYDVWLPELAPSAAAVSWALAEPWTAARWQRYVRRYRREMGEPTARHLIALLAALSQRMNLSVGCYCADASRCHRSLLREMLVAAGADVTD